MTIDSDSTCCRTGTPPPPAGCTRPDSDCRDCRLAHTPSAHWPGESGPTQRPRAHTRIRSNSDGTDTRFPPTPVRPAHGPLPDSNFPAHTALSAAVVVHPLWCLSLEGAHFLLRSARAELCPTLLLSKKFDCRESSLQGALLHCHTEVQLAPQLHLGDKHYASSHL